MKRLCHALRTVVLLAACSDDVDGLPEGCPMEAVSGQTVACDCGDAGATGVALCENDGTLGECDCSGRDGGGSGAGGSSRAGSGGSSGTGGDAGDAGSGGTGGSSSDEDGGEPTDSGEPDGGDPDPLPDDGSQGSVCEEGGDCDDGLGCFDPGTSGQGFCSATCEGDEECEAIDGASYTCAPVIGLCHVACEGADDDASCPDGMGCVLTGGVAGTPFAAYACKHPQADPLPGEQAPFERCDDETPCQEGLICDALGAFCTLSCTPIADDPCAELNNESELQAVCMGMVGGGPPVPMSQRCALDCAADESGCPDGMTCIEQGPSRLCAYE